MALITMCSYDTYENKRSSITKDSLESLYNSVNFENHRFAFVNNGSEDYQTYVIASEMVNKINKEYGTDKARYYGLAKNVGTAHGLNIAWQDRLPGEHVVKCDSDIIWHCKNWPDRMEESVRRWKRFNSADIGIIGLKRRDLGESTLRSDWGRSELLEVPHNPGEYWLYIEKAHHIMGSCCLHSSDLLDKAGYLYQCGFLYGYDDTLFCSRSRAAGMINCFLVGFDIEHIDPGETPYQTWKQSYSGMYGELVKVTMQQYESGSKSIYQGPNDK